jgi:hypothetical protein
MSLTPKRKMTEKSLAAHRRNGPKSRGAVTPEGKARAGRANLRHGFYSRAQDEVLIALGEDPAEHRRMMKSLETNLPEAMEAEVVGRIGRTFWRMRRAERIQDGLALKRVRKGMEMEQLMNAPQMLDTHKTYDRLCALARRINNPHPAPSPQEIEGLIDAFGDDPPAEIQKIFPLYRAYWEAAWKAPTPSGDGEPSPIPSAAGAERDAARKRLDDLLDPLARSYFKADEYSTNKFYELESPENIAALMAPRDENAMLMQRMEDSSLRQLWRLTNILLKVRKEGISLMDSMAKKCSG